MAYAQQMFFASFQSEGNSVYNSAYVSEPNGVPFGSKNKTYDPLMNAFTRHENLLLLCE